MIRDSKALSIVGFLLVIISTGLTACGGGGGAAGGNVPNAPAAFSPLAPADGAKGVLFSSPTFSWENAAGETSYTLQISSNASFTALVYANPGIAANATSFTLPAANKLNIGATYYWRVLAVNTGGTTASTAYSFTTKTSGDGIWSAASAASSLGTGFDTVYGMAKDSAALYAVGYDTKPGYAYWRIEKRSLSDGSLVTGFGSNGIITGLSTGMTTTDSTANAIAVDAAAGYMYVAGYELNMGASVKNWRIEKRTLATGAIASGATWTVISSGTGTTDSVAYAIAIDPTYMYIAGYDTTPGGNLEWRIEKRSLTDGQLVAAFNGDGILQNHPSGNGDDIPYGIAVDSNNLYVVGSDEVAAPGTPGWRIVILNVNSGVTITAISEGATGTAVHDEALAIAIDPTSMYVVGYDAQSASGLDEWRIEKRRLSDGSLMAAFNGDGIIQEPGVYYGDAHAVFIDGTALYIAGFDSNGAVHAEQWRIEKRDSISGALVSAFGTSGYVNMNTDYEAWSMFGDTDYLYCAGDIWQFEKLVK